MVALASGHNACPMRPETEAALSALEVALRLVRSRAGAEVVRTKGAARDVVTDTDGRVEDAVRTVLLERLPGAPVVGEERGGEAAGEGPYWLVDPICGTGNYAAGLPLYAINIALVEGGQVTVGVVTDVPGHLWHPGSTSVLAAATPELHRELVGLVRHAEAAPDRPPPH